MFPMFVVNRYVYGVSDAEGATTRLLVVLPMMWCLSQDLFNNTSPASQVNELKYY